MRKYYIIDNKRKNKKTDVKIINRGFEVAYEIIEKIKPENPVEVKESKTAAAKRILNNLLVLITAMFR